MKFYMIAMSDDPRSLHYMNKTIPSWTSRGFSVEIFEATTPKNIDSLGELKFTERKASARNRRFSETEKAVWYSHYRLWKHCIEIDQPIHVLEHDSYLKDDLPNFEYSDIEIFAVHDYTYDNKYKGIPHIVSPCAGYYITPKVAAVMINKATEKRINLNVDWTVHETYEDYHPETQRDYILFQKNLLPQCVVRQILDTKVGNTINHNGE